MEAEKLAVEMGRYTGQLGLQVYRRLNAEADKQWYRVQQTQLPKSSKLHSRQVFVERIVVNALDRFLTELPERSHLETRLKQRVSKERWNRVIAIDEAFLLSELREICRKRGLKLTGDKKELAWRLLGYGRPVKRRSL